MHDALRHELPLLALERFLLSCFRLSLCHSRLFVFTCQLSVFGFGSSRKNENRKLKTILTSSLPPSSWRRSFGAGLCACEHSCAYAGRGREDLCGAASRD